MNQTGEFYFIVLCSIYTLFTFLCVCYAYIDMKKKNKAKREN